MVNEQDHKPDYIPYIQYAARDLPVPKFGRAQDVRGGNTNHVRSIAFSCDGRKVATGTELKGLRVWNATQPMELTSSFSLPSGSKPTPHNGHVASLSFSPVEPNILVSGCKSSSGGAIVAVWDVTNPSTALQTIKIPGDILHLTFHPSGTQFAVVCPRSTRDEVFFYHRNASGQWEMREDIGLGGLGIDIGSEEINSLRFSNSGKILCAVSNDGSLNAWAYPLEPLSSTRTPSPSPETPPLPNEEDAKDGNEQGREEERQEEQGEGEGDGQGQGEDSTVEGQRQGRGREIGEMGRSGEGTPRQGSPVEERTVGDAVATEEQDKTAETGSAETRSEVPAADGDVVMDESGVKEPKGEEEDGKDVSTAPGETANTNGDVEMAEGQSSSSVSQPIPPPAQPASSSQAPSRQSTPPPTASTTASSSSNPNTTAVAVAPADANDDKGKDAKREEAKKEEEKKKAKQLKRLRHFVCHSASLLSLSFDPTGRFLAVGGQDALLSLFDTRDWICQRTYDVCTAAIRHSAFSHDGELIAIGGDDTFIAVVSVHSGQTISKLPVSGNVNSMAWHPRKPWLGYSTSSRSGVVWWMAYQD